MTETGFDKIELATHCCWLITLLAVATEAVLVVAAVLVADEEDDEEEDVDVDAAVDTWRVIWSLVKTGDHTPKTTAKKRTNTMRRVPNWFVLEAGVHTLSGESVAPFVFDCVVFVDVFVSRVARIACS